MDTLFLHRLIEAVRGSLGLAGHGPYSLSILRQPERWINLAWLHEFLGREKAQGLPFLWEGRTLPEAEMLHLEREGYRRVAYLDHVSGTIRACRNALVAVVTVASSDGALHTLLIGGERSDGDLQRLLDDYGTYARAVSRSWPFITVVGGEPLPRPAGLGWEDLFAPASLRDDLRRQVEGFFDLRDQYARLGIRHRRGLLLSGPPGNGKTTALRVIAARRPEPFFTFSIRPDSDRFDLDQAFDKALLDAPSILCFEDVDSLFGEVCPLSHFLNRLDGLAPMDGVLVVATTNHPEKLDAALTERPSRFDRIYVFPNPEAAERETYLRRLFREDYDPRIVDWTQGLSYAQIQEVRISACLEAVERGLDRLAPDMARRAIDRLRGQKTEIERDWNTPQTIGFRTGQVRISAGAISGREGAPPGRR